MWRGLAPATTMSHYSNARERPAGRTRASRPAHQTCAARPGSHQCARQFPSFAFAKSGMTPITAAPAPAWCHPLHLPCELVRRNGETLNQLIQRLDKAIHLAWTDNWFTDEVNGGPSNRL